MVTRAPGIACSPGRCSATHLPSSTLALLPAVLFLMVVLHTQLVNKQYIYIK